MHITPDCISGRICVVQELSDMAKLYWRIKVNGKWTWRPADIGLNLHKSCGVDCYRILNVPKEE